MKNKNHIEVAVIGAGTAGLAISYHLNKHHIKHIVFEKHTVGASWTNQRWDTFKLNTPNWMNLLPDETNPPTLDQDAFADHREFSTKLKSYAELHKLPIIEQTEILSLTQNNPRAPYHITACQADVNTTWLANQVVIATGSMNQPLIPKHANTIPHHIQQLHTVDYKNSTQVIGSTVLIVGSGQTGCQIAEELSKSHQVYLATGKVGRSPRRYRGLDLMDWMNKMGSMDQTTAKLKVLGLIEPTQPQVSGVGPYGHTISLQDLRRKGVTLLGRYLNTDNEFLNFDDSVLENIQYADNFSAALKKQVDTFIENYAINTSTNHQADHADKQDSEPTITYYTQIPLTNIKTVIWATGYKGNFDWVKLPIVDSNQKPIHSEGICTLPGIYFLGLPWLRKKKSGIVFGVTEDAEYIFQQIIKQMELQLDSF